MTKSPAGAELLAYPIVIEQLFKKQHSRLSGCTEKLFFWKYSLWYCGFAIIHPKGESKSGLNVQKI